MIEYKTVKFKGNKRDPGFVTFLNTWGASGWELDSSTTTQDTYPADTVEGVAYPTHEWTVVECLLKRTV